MINMNTDNLIGKLGKTDVIFTNCFKCDRLHIFNLKTLKLYGWKYQCRYCDCINDISEEDRKKKRAKK